MSDETDEEWLRRTRAEQGLPPKVEDPVAIARIVGLWRGASVEARETVGRAVPDLAAELDDMTDVEAEPGLEDWGTLGRMPWASEGGRDEAP